LPMVVAFRKSTVVRVVLFRKQIVGMAKTSGAMIVCRT
jgi:hypothetical protein